ncbi:ESPR-type extended signal peptide-containing protein, partial [Glaesserella parasuis]|uniref:ESPR-type extended signal peptide-containing protein n=2 Tax=Glaesserella parasuis TaxID=738 RepID=UPI003B67A183
MNKIFRVIWSHAQQAWVVVSELIKSHTKTSTYTDKRAQLCTSHYFLDKQQDKFKLSLLSLVLLSIFFSPVGSAAWLVYGSTSGDRGSDDGSIGIGPGSRVGSDSIAIGRLSKSQNMNSVAIGLGANAQSYESIALGKGAHTTANYAVALGSNAGASGEHSVAIGTYAQAVGNNSISIGNGANARLDSISLGREANATHTQTVAIGPKASASGAQSVAIGGDTKAQGRGSISIGNDDLDETQYQDVDGFSRYVGTRAQGHAAIAIGGKSIADGNGSVVVGPVSKATHIEGVAIGAKSTSNGDYGVAVGGSSVAGSRSASLGYKAAAGGIGSVAVGEQATTNQAKRATALGNNSIVTVDGGVALGYGSRAEMAGGVEGARQSYSITTEESSVINGLKSTQNVDNNIPIGAVSVGNDKIKRQITNVAAGTKLTDAVNVAQLKSLTMKIGGDSNAGEQPKVGLWEGILNVKGTSGEIKTSASGNTITLKLDETLKQKITDSASKEYVNTKFNEISTVTTHQYFTVGDGGTSTTKITVNTEKDKKHFDIKGKDGVTTTVVERAVEVGLTTEITNKINKIDDLETKVNNQGITFVADAGTQNNTKTDPVKLGSELKIAGGTNIGTTVSDNKGAININLDDDVVLSATGSVAFGSDTTLLTKLENNGLTVKTDTTTNAKTIEVTKTGIKAGDKKITNVAAGDVKDNSTDAINGNQLHNFIKVGDKAVAKDGVVKFANGTGTTVSAENGEIKVNVNTGTSTVDEDGKAKSTSTDHDNKIATVKDITDTVNKTFWKASTDKEGTGKQATGSENKLAKVKAGDEVKFKAGDNLIIKQDGIEDRDFTYSLNKDLKNINSIANGEENTGTKITLSPNSKKVDVGGATISNVATPVENNDAANKKYVDDYRTTVTSSDDSILVSENSNTANIKDYDIKVDFTKVANNTKLKYTANSNAQKQEVALSGGLDFKNTENITPSVAANGEVKHTLNKDLKGIDSIASKTADGNTEVTKLTLSNTANDKKVVLNDAKITGLKDGTVSDTSTDAVAGKQLHNFIKVGGNAVENGGSVTFADGTHTKIDTQTTGTIKVNVTTGVFVNPTTDGKLSQQTAGVATIENVSAAVNAGYWTAKVNGNTEVAKVKFGDSVNFVNGKGTTAAKLGNGITYNVNLTGDSTITVEQPIGNSGEVTLKVNTTTLADANADGKIDDPTAGNGSKMVSADALKTALNTTAWIVTSDKEDNGTESGQQTAEKVKAGETVTLKAGDNLDIKQNGKFFTYSLRKTIDLTNSGSVKFSNDGPILDNTGLTIRTNGPKVLTTGIDAGNKTIINVAEPTENHHAANKKYVDDSRTEVKAGKNVTVTLDTRNTAKNIYTIDAEKTTVSAVKTPAANGGEGTVNKYLSVEVGTRNETEKTTDYAIDLTQDAKVAIEKAKALNVTGADGIKVENPTDKPNEFVVKADTKTIQVGEDGKVVEPAANATADKKLITADEVAKAINKTGFKLISGDNGGTNNTENDLKTKGEIINPGDTLTMKAGKNVTVTHATGGDITFAIVESPVFSSVQFGNSGPKITSDRTSLKVTGSDGTSAVKITNVAKGEGDSDAVNVKQLNDKVATAVEKVKQSDDQDNIATVTPATKVDDYGKAGTEYVVSVRKTAVKTAAKEAIDVKGIGAISVEGKVEDGTDKKVYTVSYNGNTAAASIPLTYKSNGGTTTDTSKTVMLDKGLDFTNTTNITASIADSGVVKHTLNSDLKGITSIASKENGDGTKITLSTADNDKKVTLNDAKLTGLTAGDITDTSKDAVTGKQLKYLADKIGVGLETSSTTAFKTPEFTKLKETKGTDVTAKEAKTVVEALEATRSKVNEGLKFKGEEADGTKTITKQLGETLQFVSNDFTLTTTSNNTTTSSTAYKGENLAVVSNGSEIVVGMKDALTNIKSIANGDENTGTKITLASDKKELNVNSAKVTGLADGKVSNDSTDATTGKQLYNLVKVNGTNAVNDIENNPNKGGINFADSSTVTIVKGTNGNVTMAVSNTTLSVADSGDNIGKVTAPNTDADKAKFVNANDLSDTLNKMGFNVESGGNLATGNADGKQLIKAGDTVKFEAGNGLLVKRVGGTFTYELGDSLKTNNLNVGEKGEKGKDGTISVNGKDGSAVVINGKDGSIGLNGKDGANGVTIKGDQGPAGVDGGKKTRIVYEYKDPNKPGTTIKEEIATLKDGQKYSGDNYKAAEGDKAEENVIAKKLNERLEIKGGADTTKLSDNNIGVIAENGVLNVKLAKNIDLGTDGSVTTGNTTMNDSGITIKKPTNAGDKKSDVKLTASGLDNGGNVISNVAEGKKDTDAVNVKQLKDTVNAAATDVVSNDGSIDVMGEVDAVTGKNTYDLSVKTSAITVKAGNQEAASDGNNGYVKADDVVNAINKTTKAARTEVTDGRNTQVVATTGENGQDIYNVSVSGLPMEYATEDGKSIINMGGNFYLEEPAADGSIKLIPVVNAKGKFSTKTQNPDGSVTLKPLAVKVNLANEAPMVLGNVAEGVADTDAVNVKQLKSAKTEVESTDHSVVIKERQGDNQQIVYDLTVAKTKLTASEDKRTISAEDKGNHFATGDEVAAAINTATAAARTEVEAGKNVKVTSKTGANDQNIYKVSVSGDLSDITSISNGDTKVSLGKDEQGNPVVNMNGARITNIGDGSTEGDVVNVRQLNTVVSSMNAGF